MILVQSWTPSRRDAIACKAHAVPFLQLMYIIRPPGASEGSSHVHINCVSFSSTCSVVEWYKSSNVEFKMKSSHSVQYTEPDLTSAPAGMSIVRTKILTKQSLLERLKQ